MQSKIFLHYERGITESDWFRSYHTFNYGNYNNLYKQPFDSLIILNDETLAPQHSINLIADNESIVFIVPLVGEVYCKTQDKYTDQVIAGNIWAITLKKDETFTITNPYEEDLVNYLQIWFTADNSFVQKNILSFDIINQKNQLYSIVVDKKINLHIGKFDGRKEVKHAIQKQSVYAFVIAGAFEIEGCLLHAKDGLAMQEINSIELEALSNEAIILVLEYN